MKLNTTTKIIIGAVGIYGIYYFFFKKKATVKKGAEKNKKDLENKMIPKPPAPTLETKDIKSGSLGTEDETIYNNIVSLFNLNEKPSETSKQLDKEISFSFDYEKMRAKAKSFVLAIPKTKKGYWVKLTATMLEAKAKQFTSDEESQRFLITRMGESGFHSLKEIKTSGKKLSKAIMGL